MTQRMNDGWQFCLLPNGSTLHDALHAEWTAVDLPHDWLIWHADDLYRNGDGWYRRTLTLPKAQDGFRRLLRFDGVYMDCDVLVNGQLVCCHRYGYTAFDADMTQALHSGDNEIFVQVRYISPNSRWYSGAGIFRDVSYCQLPPRHILPDGVYVTTTHEDDLWHMSIRTELGGNADGAPLVHRLLDAAGCVVAETVCASPDDQSESMLSVKAPALWSCDTPCCYTLESVLGEQTERQTVGFRDVQFTTDHGMFLNGKPVKLHGVCLHHDLGALGSAFHEKAAKRQLRLMREMGVNALRTSHNPPARQVMELCDHMGILVVSEAFDMWERSKTSYDYARFFPECWQEDVASWVRRDRNHPSLLMWSIGNEILDTHIDERGRELTRMLADEVLRHDPCRNGVVTTGLNYMPWENAQKCVDLIKFAGYNYAEKYYEAHHEKYPDWYIYGSETASLLSSRGVYHFPADTPILSDVDQQCSSLGNSQTSWGTHDIRGLIADDLNTPYSMGQFLWSGIDYIGEPTPYHTRSCYFGYVDTAGFHKDLYYLFRAAWTDLPMIHIGVSWDWNPGQMIDVNVMTNAASAELFLNGRSLGRKAVDFRQAAQCMPCWSVPFEPGELLACGYNAQGECILQTARHTCQNSAALRLEAEDAYLLADNHDLTFITISSVDENGVPVANAADRVEIEVEGPAVVMGMDNGDPTDTDPYKATTRRLFSGKLLLMLGALDAPGEVTIRVRAHGLPTASLTLPVLPAEPVQGVSRNQRISETAGSDVIHVRKIELLPQGSTVLTPDRREVSFRWKLLPENASLQPITWQVTNAKGIESASASLTVTEDEVTLHALGDGKVYLRAMVNNGYPHPRLISQQEVTIAGLGKTHLDPYGFIAGGLYDIHSGEITPGNDKGVAFARGARSMVGFRHVDFGSVGTEEIELPIFALDDNAYEVEMYLGNPDEGRRSLPPSITRNPASGTYISRKLTVFPGVLQGCKRSVSSFTRRSICEGFAVRPLSAHGFRYLRWRPMPSMATVSAARRNALRISATMFLLFLKEWILAIPIMCF